MGSITTAKISRIEDLPRMNVNFQEYNEKFEESFLQYSSQRIRDKYYAAMDHNCPDELDNYLWKVDTLINHDMEIAHLFLPTHTLPKLKAIYVYELLVARVACFRKGGFRLLVDRALCNLARDQSENSEVDESRSIEGVIDDTTATFKLAFRLFSLADDIFPPSNVYLYGSESPDQSVNESQGHLLELLVGALYEAGINKCHTIASEFFGGSCDKMASKRCRAKGSSEGRNDCESRKKFAGSRDLEDRLNFPGSMLSSHSSPSTSAEIVKNICGSPPHKRQKGDDDKDSPIDNIIRSKKLERRVSNTKKQQKTRKFLERDYARKILRLFAAVNTLVLSAFDGTVSFIKAAKKIYQEILNKTDFTLDGEMPFAINQIEIFSSYCDTLLSVSMLYVALVFSYF